MWDTSLVIRSGGSEGAASSGPAVVVNVTSTAEASPTVHHAGSSSSSAAPSLGVPMQTSSTSSASGAAAPKAQAPAAGSRFRVSSPTQRHIDYIAIICARKRFVLADVLGRIGTRADASAWIDANK